VALVLLLTTDPHMISVNHVWSPIGSKIVAQLVGCAVIPQNYVLAIDDDCESVLPDMRTCGHHLGQVTSHRTYLSGSICSRIRGLALSHISALRWARVVRAGT
jgi:hypothetical protein